MHCIFQRSLPDLGRTLGLPTEPDDVQYLLQACVCACGVVGGLADAYAPAFAFVVFAFCNNLAAYLNHIVVDADALEQMGDAVAAVAFCYCAAIEHYRGVLFDYSAVCEAYFFVSDILQEAVNGEAIDLCSLLESESPSVDKGGDGNVERAVCGCRYFLCKVKDCEELGIGQGVAVLVNGGY